MVVKSVKFSNHRIFLQNNLKINKKIRSAGAEGISDRTTGLPLLNWASSEIASRPTVILFCGLALKSAARRIHLGPLLSQVNQAFCFDKE
jgi:hypothetical protein